MSDPPLLAKLREYYGISLSDPNADIAGSRFLSVPDLLPDRGVDPETYGYRSVDIEHNISVLQTISARGLSDKAAFLALGEKALLQALTIEEFFRQDLVYQDEVAAGLFEVSFLEATAARDS